MPQFLTFIGCKRANGRSLSTHKHDLVDLIVDLTHIDEETRSLRCYIGDWGWGRWEIMVGMECVLVCRVPDAGGLECLFSNIIYGRSTTL